MRKSALTGIFLTGIFAAILISGQTAFAEPHLVGWWKLDEGSGTIAHDSAGDNNGFVEGATWTSGRIWGALDFDGVDDYVVCEDESFLEPDSFTISAWIKPGNVSSKQHIAGQVGKEPISESDCGFGYRLVINDNGKAGLAIDPCGCDNENIVESTTSLQPGQWYFVTGTYYNSNATIYLNGEPENSGVEILDAYYAVFLMGARHSDNRNWYFEHFEGLIDDVRIYDRALSTEEIRQLYREGAVKAFAPSPSDEVMGVEPNTILSWSPGCYAASHDVYLGTDYDDVNDANFSSPEYKGNFDVNSWDPCGLDGSTAYYWRIDEVNSPNVWKGDVWTFRTTDNNGQLYVPSEYPTIQAAIDASVNGDVVIVAPGAYTGPGNRDIDFNGKAITVRSENGPESCIIDCNGTTEENHRGFCFHSAENPDSILDGFTITNGYWYDASTGGGGIYCQDQTNPTIRNCIITNNESDHGGGIWCFRSSPRIINCVITKNRAGTHYGGGFYLWYSSMPTITGCTIANNSAIYGGGAIYSGYFSDPEISSSIIWNNNSTNGEDEIDTSSLYGTATISYSDVRGSWPGIGNIDTDPCFVTGPEGDYYLSQIAAGQAGDSPCVNAGSDTAANLGMEIFTTRTDEIGDGGVVDMGYHHSMPNPADINGDGFIDFADYAILASQWLQAPGEPSADIAPPGGDNIVDFLDLSVLVDNWLSEGIVQ